MQMQAHVKDRQPRIGSEQLEAKRRSGSASWIALFLLVFICIDTSLADELKTKAAPHPHIVLIVADDLGWNDVGFNGSTIKTPHLDSLAASGMRFEQLYVAPTCSATRAGLLTGRRPFHLGLQVGVIKDWSTFGLPLEERTLASAFKDAGYRTAMIGKWHLGTSREEFLPRSRGFDYFYGNYGGSVGYNNHKTARGVLDWQRNGETVNEKGYVTTLSGLDAARLIQAHDVEVPLFLYVAFNAPHRPLQAPKSYLDRYPGIEDERRRTYAAMVSSLDDEVGRIVKSLEARGMHDNTLILFLSDNGGTESGGGSNDPLRGGKGSFYEGGIRSASFIHWPGEIKAGTSTAALLHVTDWFPTLLGLAGGNLEQPLPLDGVDIWPTLTQGAPSPHREELVLYVFEAAGAIRRGDWKLVIPPGSSKKAPVSELYHLGKDPNETKDLAGSEPEKLALLEKRLDFYRKQAVAMKRNPKKGSDRLKARTALGKPEEAN
jgi:arylsulfatase A-like enzyme